MSIAETVTTVEPTAIEPQRVLVLDDREQRLLIEAMRTAIHDRGGDWPALQALLGRVAHGDEYYDPADELDRTTLRKRRLETEVRRCNRRLEDLNEIVVEELLERGERKITREATGSTLSIMRKIFAKVVPPSADPTDEDKAAAKAAAGEALERAGLGHFVRADFNLNTVSAYFGEQVKAYLAEQEDLPEHERVPRPIESFIPEELRGFIELTDKPTISVRAAN